MFEATAIPRELIEHLDSTLLADELRFDEVVVDELIYGTSLLQHIELESGSMYEIHQLIHQFITLDTKTEE